MVQAIRWDTNINGPKPAYSVSQSIPRLLLSTRRHRLPAPKMVTHTPQLSRWDRTRLVVLSTPTSTKTQPTTRSPSPCRRRHLQLVIKPLPCQRGECCSPL